MNPDEEDDSTVPYRAADARQTDDLEGFGIRPAKKKKRCSNTNCGRNWRWWAVGITVVVLAASFATWWAASGVGLRDSALLHGWHKTAVHNDDEFSAMAGLLASNSVQLLSAMQLMYTELRAANVSSTFETVMGPMMRGLPSRMRVALDHARPEFTCGEESTCTPVTVSMARIGTSIVAWCDTPMVCGPCTHNNIHGDGLSGAWRPRSAGIANVSLSLTGPVPPNPADRPHEGIIVAQRLGSRRTLLVVEPYQPGTTKVGLLPDGVNVSIEPWTMRWRTYRDPLYEN